MGAYKLDWVAQNIARRIGQSGFKNEEISCEQFAKIAKISGNTARGYTEQEIQQIDAYLPNPFSITCRLISPKGGMRIRVSGCRYGPLGLIAYPVLPRIHERIYEFAVRCIDCLEEGSEIREGWRQARQKRRGFNL